MGTWTAEVTNDPERDYDLYVELLCDGEYMARIQKNQEGELELITYGDAALTIPLAWLVDIADRARQEIS